jgi:hypothetical protein
MRTNLKPASQSPTSCPFHLTTSNTCNIPFSFQFASKMQSNTVKGGKADGNRAKRDFPRSRDRSVVFGTDQEWGKTKKSSEENNVPTPATPADCCVTAKHRLPTGTGATATQPVSKSLGKPSTLS